MADIIKFPNTRIYKGLEAMHLLLAIKLFEEWERSL